MLNRGLFNRATLLWLAALLLVAGFCALGRWQLQRGESKQAMLDGVAAALRDKRALSISEAETRDPHGYDWVAGHGRLLASPVLLLDNQRRGEAVGVRVFAALRPREGQPLLVDLGWLPVSADRRFPEPVLPPGELRVEGLLSPPTGSGLAIGPAFTPLEPAGAKQRLLMTRLDLQALSKQLQLPLSARVLRLDPALPIGYARDLEILANTLTPERHRGYALQWFGLAFATFATALFMSFRRPSK